MSDLSLGGTKIVLLLLMLTCNSIAEISPTDSGQTIENPKEKRGFTPFPKFNLFVEQPLVVSTCPYEFVRFDSDSTFKVIISPEMGVAGGRIAIGIGDYRGWIHCRAHLTGTWLNPKEFKLEPLPKGLHSGIDFEFMFFIVTMRCGFLYSFTKEEIESPISFSGGLGLSIGQYIMAKVKD